jgi:hypothetical protein
MSTLNCTEELMLLSSCIDCNEEKQKQIVAIIKSNSIDWNYFVNRALDTLLGPVIYRCFESLNAKESVIPAEVMYSLKNIYNAVLMNNMRLAGNFETLLPEFEKKDIRVIALKGMNVIHSLYSDIGVRQTSDIDLLFYRSDAAAARDIFFQADFHCQYYMPEGALRVTNHPSPYKFYNDEVSYDFHVGLNKVYEQARIPMEDIFSRTVQKNIFPKSSFSILDHNDNFIYLTQHLSEHFHSFDCKLVSFLDLVELIRRDLIQWEVIVERSIEWNCFESMSEMIFLTSEYFNTVVPVELTAKLSTSKKEELKAMFEKLVREPRTQLKDDHAYQGSTGFLSIKHLSIVGKLRYFFHRVFADLPYLKSKYRNYGNSYLSLIALHLFSINVIAVQSLKKRLIK